jgi:hypothetical protein
MEVKLRPFLNCAVGGIEWTYHFPSPLPAAENLKVPTEYSAGLALDTMDTDALENRDFPVPIGNQTPIPWSFNP